MKKRLKKQYSSKRQTPRAETPRPEMSDESDHNEGDLQMKREVKKKANVQNSQESTEDGLSVAERGVQLIRG